MSGIKARPARKVYNPALRQEVQRRFEWVPVDDGEICVWEMTVNETLSLVSNSMRPPEWPGSPVDEQSAILWQIMLSCYDDEPPTGKRMFQDHQADDVGRLKHHEYRDLMAAIGRMNGTGDNNLEGLNDFFKRDGGEPKPS